MLLQSPDWRWIFSTFPPTLPHWRMMKMLDSRAAQGTSESEISFLTGCLVVEGSIASAAATLGGHVASQLWYLLTSLDNGRLRNKQIQVFPKDSACFIVVDGGVDEMLHVRHFLFGVCIRRVFSHMQTMMFPPWTNKLWIKQKAVFSCVNLLDLILVGVNPIQIHVCIKKEFLWYRNIP